MSSSSSKYLPHDFNIWYDLFSLFVGFATYICMHMGFCDIITKGKKNPDSKLILSQKQKPLKTLL